MLRSLLMLVVAFVMLACTSRKPTAHDQIIAELRGADRLAVFSALERVLNADSIPVLLSNRGEGIIVTDSFTVPPHYCDCGTNFFGAEYPGTRRGKLQINLKSNSTVRVEFKFETLLTIDVNRKQLNCTTFGVLEKRILDELEVELGTVRIDAQD